MIIRSIRTRKELERIKQELRRVYRLKNTKVYQGVSSNTFTLYYGIHGMKWSNQIREELG